MTIMGAWLVVLGGGFFFNPEMDRATAILLAFAGAYAMLWQEPALIGFAADQFFHVSLAQPVFLFFLSAAIFLWAYWLFQRHVEMLEDVSGELSEALTVEKTLLDILSHDLRNPLTVLHTRLAAVTNGHATFEDQADGFESTLLRAERVIENSVVYSRLASKGDLETEPLDLTRLTEDVLADVETHAALKDVELELDTPGPIEVEVTPLIQHALENVLDNAIKYSPEGEAVHVRLATGDRTAKITVEDHGPGLDPADRERLLERFERGEAPTTDGSGLGLAIVRRLVDVHDGTLTIDGTGDGGTAVTIELPRHLPADPDDPHTTPTTRPAASPGGLP